MRLFLRSRYVGWVIAAVIALQISLLWWGAPAMVIRHNASFFAVPLAVVAQFSMGFAAAYITSSDMNRAERLSSRALWPYRLAIMALFFGALVVASGGVSIALGPLGTLDAFAPLRAATGLACLGVIASSVLPRLIAGVVPTAFVFFPLVFDPEPIPGGAILAFTAAEPSVAWCTVVGLTAAAFLVATLGWSFGSGSHVHTFSSRGTAAGTARAVR